MEIARTIHETYQRITPNVTTTSSSAPQLINQPINRLVNQQESHPIHQQTAQAINPTTSNSNSNVVQQEQFDNLIQSSSYQFSNTPTPETIQIMNDLEFGTARKDIEKEGKRFEWIKEELDYLVHYIETIESDSINRYANCLNHLRTEAPIEVKKYFHPHHVANSDRLKNGYNAARKLRG